MAQKVVVGHSLVVVAHRLVGQQVGRPVRTAAVAVVNMMAHAHCML